jgi:multiple RNA-binding domain-containing protein 1
MVMPDYGLAAIIEFSERQEARDAFKKLAYRKFKNLPLYLEWAPVDIFNGDPQEKAKLQKEEEEKEAAAKDSEQKKQQNNLKTDNADYKAKKETENDDDLDDDNYEENATIFVKNLNFDTDEEALQKMFSKIGKCKATIARKISTKQESLSMGYGFVKFKKAAHAKEALKTLQNHCLDGHNLELKFSNRTSNGNQSTNKKTDANGKQSKTKSSKILVRNIPFEAKAKEIQELFQVFGELKYVRLPKKIDGAHRGFGFVDFVTINDAEVDSI